MVFYKISYGNRRHKIGFLKSSGLLVFVSFIQALKFSSNVWSFTNSEDLFFCSRIVVELIFC